jgi:hypothetical protein
MQTKNKLLQIWQNTSCRFSGRPDICRVCGNPVRCNDRCAICYQVENSLHHYIEAPNGRKFAFDCLLAHVKELWKLFCADPELFEDRREYCTEDFMTTYKLTRTEAKLLYIAFCEHAAGVPINDCMPT